VNQLELPAPLLANLSGNRERRRLVRFDEIPPRLVHAVISAEDKRFFEHSGLDLPRVMKAMYVDVKSGHKDQGASTLTMQLVRNFWLDSDKRWKRKLLEVLITLQIEFRLTKQQIFEDYSNQVYLGRRNTFSISGFAEGAHAYFDKELSQLDNGEAALLAGLIQRPSYYNPFRYPDRARDRRNIVLTLMRRNGYLTDDEYRAASASPLQLRPEREAGAQSYYFLDLVRDEVQDTLEGQQQAHAVYTSLDLGLQDAAEAAVRLGMEGVDRQLRRSGKVRLPADQPQVALIALDPHTGAIKALVGGRDYRASQLNHAIAKRQPGSVFKPIVYAAALSTAGRGGHQVFTPASMVDGSPSNFGVNGINYEPKNYHNEESGAVSLRYALVHSLNIPAVRVANAAGLDRVVRTAYSLGLNSDIKATPAVALGAYETTPLEIAGAYTAFANQGMYVGASLVSEMRDADEHVLYNRSPKGRPALDPRVTYLMVNMMQDVLTSGTGAGVRSHGFTQPAAGKTGTSRDGWFAGFTSQLLCVVWVGFDDNRDLRLEGARSALPIWAEFMKRASHMAPYNDAKPFASPGGIQRAQLCEESGELAGPYCPRTRTDIFIDGTQPVKQCSMHESSDAALATPTPAAASAPVPASAAPRGDSH
jgi:penicillin-binding protein 1B